MGRLSTFGIGPTATFKPSKVANLVNWYDFTDTSKITQDSAKLISQVDDKSGSARHITAATTARPTASRTDNKENLLLASEDFSSGSWTIARLNRTANQAANPIDGTVNADRVYDDSNTGTHVIYQTAARVRPNTTYRFSVYVRPSSRSISLRFDATGGTVWSGGLTPYVHFDVDDGIVYSADPTCTAAIWRVASNWYLLDAWATTAATVVGSAVFDIYLTNPVATTSYTGDGSSGVYLWGAQVASRWAASEYLTTTSAPLYASGDIGVDPIPQTTDYWSVLQEWGGYLNTYMGTTVILYSDNALLCTYYEGELARYMLAEHFNSSATYFPMADKCYHSYRNYYAQPSGFGIPGYWAFCEGLADRFIRRQKDKNFILNPSFTSATTSWTATSSTLASVAGGQSGNCLQVTNSGAAAGSARQTYTAWRSTLYSFTGYFKKGTGASGRFKIGTTAGGGELYDSGPLSDAGWTQYSTSFTTPSSTTATTVSIYFSLWNDSTTAGETSLFDTLTLTTVQAQTDIEQICANAAYHSTAVGGYNTIEGNYPSNYATEGHALSREWSYVVMNYIQLARCRSLTAAEIARRDFCFEDLFRIIDWWCISRTASYVRPFMAGILAHAMVNYYEFVSKDSRILPNLKILAQYLIDTCYYPDQHTFAATDRQGTPADAWSWGSDPGSGDRAPAWDLNQLITPLYAWLWKQTAETKYRTWGDDLFVGGIAVYTGSIWTSGTYLGSRDASSPLGKQFNQQFDWGKRYVEYGSWVPTLDLGKCRAIFDGTSDGMSGTNGAAAQPATDIIACNCVGSVAANRPIVDCTGTAKGSYTTTGNLELNAGTALTYASSRETPTVVSLITNGASSVIRKNGQLVASGNAGANAPGATIYYGKNAAGTEFFGGDMLEAIRYSRALSPEEAYRVEKWLCTKHGITAYAPPVAFTAGTYGTVLYWADFTTSANVLNSSSTPAADGEAIMTINDASASAINLTQATAGYRPVCETAVVNGWQVARFDGGDGFALSTSEAGTLSKDRTGLTYMIVLNSTDFTNNQSIFQFYGSAAPRTSLYLLNTSANLAVTGTPQDGGTTATDFWTSGMSPSTWYVICVVWDFVNNIQKAWVNNSLVGTNSSCGWTGANSSNTDCTASDGQWQYFNYYGSAGIVGDVGESVLWLGAMSDTTVATMCTAAGAKYGLTI